MISRQSFLLILLMSFSLLHAETFSKEKEVDDYIQKKIKAKKIAGAVVSVHHKGSSLMHKSYGYQDLADKIKMDTNSIFRIYSMTKPLTTFSAMILVDRGDIKLDDPITKYIPELKDLKVLKGFKKDPLKRDITIRDLMRHTSGFAYGLGLGVSAVDMKYNVNHPLFVANGDQMIDRLKEYPIQSQPGVEYHYSISVDVLGVLVERVSGLSLYQFMKKNIFDKIGMKDTHFQLPQDKIDRFCSIYGVNLREKESYKSSKYSGLRMEQGGGGLISTSSDYLKFCQLMLNNGIHKSDTILDPKWIEEMTKNQLPEGQGVYKRNGKVAIGFGLGFSVGLEEWGEYGHKGDYGWSGIGGTHFIISPSTETVIIIMTQKQPLMNGVKEDLKRIIYKGL